MIRQSEIRELEDKIDFFYSRRRAKHELLERDAINDKILELEEKYFKYTSKFYLPTILFRESVCDRQTETFI